MALPTSGIISLSDIQTEFGGTNPIAISEYYGSYGIPSSGALSMGGTFHGAEKFISMVATGGTVTTDGDYKVHTFTSSGSFVISSIGTDSAFDFMTVAGGGGSGKGPTSPSWRAGGGGAGGFRTSYGSLSGGSSSPESTLTGVVGTYGVTVGAGGNQGNGSNSSFYGLTSNGGGKGGNAINQTPGNASSGGSGGGASGGTYYAGAGSGTAGQGTAGNTGNPGGYASGIGGGAQTNGAGGGTGITTTITGSSLAYGTGLSWEVHGGVNTGDGAGRSGGYTPGTVWFIGGSGIVVVRYKFQ
jgi:hypothetical protein